MILLEVLAWYLPVCKRASTSEAWQREEYHYERERSLSKNKNRMENEKISYDVTNMNVKYQSEGKKCIRIQGSFNSSEKSILRTSSKSKGKNPC